MKEGIVRITEGGKIADTELGREVIRMINKESNKVRNCNNKYERLMVRHTNLMQRHSELKDEYSALKIKHRHTVTKYNSITRLNERLRKELKGKLIKEEWTEIEKEREDTHGELQIYD